MAEILTVRAEWSVESRASPAMMSITVPAATTDGAAAANVATIIAAAERYEWV